MTLPCVSAAAKHENVRIMSFNIRVQLASDTGKHTWDARKTACVKAIEKNRPDVLGLQEATYGQKDYLANELPAYMMVDRSAKPGTLDPEVNNNENPIMFRTDRFELLDYGYFWLNEEQMPDQKGWDAMFVRNTTWVKLKFKKSGQIIFCFNTHFDNVGETARQESSILTIKKIKEIAGDKAVVFLAGDFNMACDEREIKPLETYLQAAELKAKKADENPSFNDYGQFGTKPMWLDHIFSRKAEARSFKVVNYHKYGVDYISDHYPVYSDFKIFTN